MTTTLTLADLQAALRDHSGLGVAVVLPDGREIPREFHVTEAGTVTKNFIDCGGKARRRVTAQLQTWTGDDVDHRLRTERLAKILAVCAPVLPPGDTALEVEYEDGVAAQYPVTGLETHNGFLRIQLGLRHTECLARVPEMAESTASAECGCGNRCG